MDDREFLDGLYLAWTKTTAAEHGGWSVEKIGDSFTVMARDPSGSVVLADLIQEEKDAEFIAGMHTILPDLVRRLNDALDEADRLDTEKDELHARIFELELEVGVLEGMLDVG
ncbi:hypothetical protein ACWCPQ_14315 [Nocardia sp. NPDC001965]